MNTNFKNMIAELEATYDSLSFYVEAMDFKGHLEYDKKFDERLLWKSIIRTILYLSKENV